MYFLGEISIPSSCGLSKAAMITGEPVYSLMVYPLSSGINFVYGFTRSLDYGDMRESLRTDFITLNINKDKNGEFFAGKKQGHGLMISIIENGGIPLFPILADSGVEKFQFILYSKENWDKIIADIEKSNRIESNFIKRIDGEIPFFSDFGMPKCLFGLTDIEFRILRDASENGFYEWPRSYDLKNIKTSVGLSKPTLLYHIRNGERKVISKFMNYVK